MDARYLLRSLAQGFMGKEQPEHKDLGKGVGRPTGVRGQPGDAALLVRTLGAGREVEHGAGPEPGALLSRPTRTSTPAEHMEAQTGTADSRTSPRSYTARCPQSAGTALHAFQDRLLDDRHPAKQPGRQTQC